MTTWRPEDSCDESSPSAVGVSSKPPRWPKGSPSWTPPDCIVLDLELPDGPGETILRKVRLERLPIRVVVNTGMPESGRLSEVSYMRPDAVLQKPLDAAGLLTICNGMNY